MSTKQTEVPEVLERLRAEAAQVWAEEKRRQEERRQQIIEAARARTAEALGTELMQALGVTVRLDGRYPVITLRYRGKRKEWRQQVVNAPKLEIAKWMEEVDAQLERYAEDRARQRKDLLFHIDHDLRAGRGSVYRYRYNGHEQTATKWDLLEDDEVSAALAAYLERVLQYEAEEAREERLKAEKKAEERRIERARLLKLAETAQTWDELRPLTAAVDPGCHYGYPEFYDDAELTEAWRAAVERVERLEEEREVNRLKEQERCFVPFYYYRVTYAIAAFDSERGWCADTGSFDSLKGLPDRDDWWYPVRPGRGPVRVAHLVKVERLEVQSVGDIPPWAPTVNTDYGPIKGLPEGAETLIPF